MPAHVKDKRGAVKLEKRSTKHATTPQKAGPGTRSDHPDWLTVKSKAVTPKPTESWWMQPEYQEWDAFSARAQELDSRRQNGIAASPGGYRD